MAAATPAPHSSRDSSTVFVVQETGTYYILEGSWTDDGSGQRLDGSRAGGLDIRGERIGRIPARAGPAGRCGRRYALGGGGSDLLDGGLAADTLTGGAGEDSFRFSTALGSGNVDWIKDFNVADDRSCWTTSIFADVGGNGALALSAFFKSAAGAAHDADDRIIYDTDNGHLCL